MEKFHIDPETEVPGIFIFEKKYKEKFYKYRMPGYEKLTVDAIVEFEQDYRNRALEPTLLCKSHKHLRKYVEGSMEEITVKQLIELMKKTSKTLKSGETFSHANILVYMYYHTCPNRKPMLSFLKFLAQDPRFNSHTLIRVVDLSHNELPHELKGKKHLFLFYRDSGQTREYPIDEGNEVLPQDIMWWLQGAMIELMGNGIDVSSILLPTGDEQPDL